MITSGRNSVNVSRKDLLAKLKENVVIHKKDYEEALLGYKIKLIEDLNNKLKEVGNSTPETITKIHPVSFSRPASYEKEYNEIIDMMEASVDEVINLDGPSFRSYFKNEWSWSDSFNASATMYKNALSNGSN